MIHNRVDSRPGVHHMCRHRSRSLRPLPHLPVVAVVAAAVGDADAADGLLVGTVLVAVIVTDRRPATDDMTHRYRCDSDLPVDIVNARHDDDDAGAGVGSDGDDYDSVDSYRNDCHPMLILAFRRHVPHDLDRHSRHLCLVDGDGVARDWLPWILRLIAQIRPVISVVFRD